VPGAGDGGGMNRNRHRWPPVQAPLAFVAVPVPPDVILGRSAGTSGRHLCYRDVEELLAERGIAVDHVTRFRWVQRFTPELIEAARPCRHFVGDRWFTGETHVEGAGVWRYVYRAVDQHDQVIDVCVFRRRDMASARYCFTAALRAHGTPSEVITDRTPALANVIEELILAAFRNTGQYENNRCEADHGRLKARLGPMYGLKTDWTASVVIRGHSNIWNLRRGHYELGVETAPVFGLATAFDELQLAI
jgi:IS6 family transposase